MAKQEQNNNGSNDLFKGKSFEQLSPEEQAEFKEALKKKEAEEQSEKDLLKKEAMAAQKKRKEIKRKEREKAAEEKKYTVRPGTGKFFHVLKEQPAFNKQGKKKSRADVQLMIFETFIQWLKSAARLGFSFGLAHDPIKFFTDKQQQEVIEALKVYVKDCNIDTIEFGVENLCLDSKSLVNQKLNLFLKKKKEHFKAKEEATVKEKSYLD